MRRPTHKVGRASVGRASCGSASVGRASRAMASGVPPRAMDATSPSCGICRTLVLTSRADTTLSNVIPTPRRAPRARGDHSREHSSHRAGRRGTPLHRTRRPTHKVGHASVGRASCGSASVGRASRAMASDVPPRAMPATNASCGTCRTLVLTSRADTTLSNVIPTPRRAPRSRGDHSREHSSHRAGRRGTPLHRTRRPTHKVGHASVGRASCGSASVGRASRAMASDVPPRAMPATNASCGTCRTLVLTSRADTTLSNVIPTPRRAPRSRGDHSREHSSHRAGRRGTPPCIGRDVQPTKWVTRPWVAPPVDPRLWVARPARWRAASRCERWMPRARPAAFAAPSFSPPAPNRPSRSPLLRPKLIKSTRITNFAHRDEIPRNHPLRSISNE